jgi:hypothetical protein
MAEHLRPVETLAGDLFCLERAFLRMCGSDRPRRGQRVNRRHIVRLAVRLRRSSTAVKSSRSAEFDAADIA